MPTAAAGKWGSSALVGRAPNADVRLPGREPVPTVATLGSGCNEPPNLGKAHPRRTPSALVGVCPRDPCCRNYRSARGQGCRPLAAGEDGRWIVPFGAGGSATGRRAAGTHGPAHRTSVALGERRHAAWGRRARASHVPGLRDKRHGTYSCPGPARRWRFGVDAPRGATDHGRVVSPSRGPGWSRLVGTGITLSPPHPCVASSGRHSPGLAFQ